LRLAIKTQSDMAELPQVLSGHVADGGHGVARVAQLKLAPGLQLAVHLAVTVDKAKLFDIRGRTFAEGNQHLVAERIGRALANAGDGGLVNYGHHRNLLLVNKAGDK